MSRPMDRSGSGAEDRGGSSGSSNDLVGATLGNYRISKLLGQGGMGSVYLGEHLLIGRKVAVKVLDPQVASHPEVVSRFFVEARAVNEIRHPNIVEVTDLGTHEGRPFIVMEYLQGETIEDRIARVKRLDPEDCVAIVRQVASALGAAHQVGMVHRDLKPANIMLCDHPDYPDFVKVLDFGIAKLLRATHPARHQTVLGSLLGTPGYMSPEQCLGDVQLDHRSDIYSLGVILFLIVSGRPPFQDDTFGRLIMAHVQPAPAQAGGDRARHPADAERGGGEGPGQEAGGSLPDHARDAPGPGGGAGGGGLSPLVDPGGRAGAPGPLDDAAASDRGHEHPDDAAVSDRGHEHPVRLGARSSWSGSSRG